MTPRHQNYIVAPGLLAIGLILAGCQESTTPTATANRPSFWQGVSQCTIGKWTGGGRIDPTGNHSAANYDNADETSGGQPVAPAFPSFTFLTGKVTFGFNVFLGADGGGNCVVNKGEIEVNGHVAKIA